MDNVLFKKFLTYFYGSGIGLIIGLITTMISTRLLLPEEFGKASMFILAVQMMMIFLVFGTDQAFVRFFYEEKTESRNRLLLNTLKFPLVLSGFVLLLLFLFRKHILLFLFDEVNMLIFWVLVSSIIFHVIYRFSLLVIRMQHKAHIYSLIEVLHKLLNLGLLTLLYFLIGARYEILIFSTAITLVIVTVTSVFFEKKFWAIPIKTNVKVKHSQRDIFKFSYPLVLTTLITWLFESFDKIAIRQWSNFEEVGLYTAAFRIVALLTVGQAAFSTFWAPVCYEHFEKNSTDVDFFSKTSKLVGFAMFVIAVLTILFKDIIIMLLGPEYSKAATIMPFLIFMPLMYTLSETTVIGINFFKKTKWHILIASVPCIVNIIGNFLLVPLFGAAGAAASTGLSYVLFFMLRTHLSLKYYQVDYGLKRIYFLIACTVIYALQNSIFPHHFLTYMAGIVLLAVISFLYKYEISQLIVFFKGKRKAIETT